MPCKIEAIAAAQRAAILNQNIYSADNVYGPSHPNANQEVGSDDPLNKKGRGTGGTFDTSFNAGNYTDKFGRPEVYNSGRQAVYTNFYNPNNSYDTFECV